MESKRDGHGIYGYLSPAEVEGASIQPLDRDRSRQFVSAMLRRVMPRAKPDLLEEKLKRHAVVLNKGGRGARAKRKKKAAASSSAASSGASPASGRPLSSRERRRLGLFDIRPENQRYALFLPLHQLWLQYIDDLFGGLKSTTRSEQIQMKMLKADLHGAIITVEKSKCPTYVGTTGIMIQELKNVFKIITKDDKLKVIPKRKSIFAVAFGGFVSHIYGSMFCMRSSERSAKKFKAKGSVDL
ncbi:ribonuclease P protein subunit p29 isoform X1 [Petromyzon marinus]|uniref:ribonuclease P protein subunit p29 isoform X1 n=1 Tax=Petromyzon marinus TaxID=7757 RepID=UPI003F6F02B6